MVVLLMQAELLQAWGHYQAGRYADAEGYSACVLLRRTAGC